LYPLLTVCYFNVTDMQFLHSFVLLCSVLILIFFVLSYFSSLRFCGDFSDTSPRNAVIVVTECKLTIFQRVMNSILTDLETGTLVCYTHLSWYDSPYWARARARASSLSRLHDHTQLYKTQLVGLLWTSDQPGTDTST